MKLAWGLEWTLRKKKHLPAEDRTLSQRITREGEKYYCNKLHEEAAVILHNTCYGHS